MGGYEIGWCGMGFSWLALLLFIATLIYFISSSKKDDISARDILDKRYARGEIDEEEYKIKRDAIGEY